MYSINRLGQSLLADVHSLFDQQKIGEAMDKLMFGLLKIRRQFPYDWLSFVKRYCRTHPVKQVVHQSPFTHRAFHKPRGYAGDAVMMDYIYAQTRPVEISSRQIKDIYQYEIETPGCASVRERRDIATRYIDEICTQNPEANIMSIACGHLREIKRSMVIHNGDFSGRFIALDQDNESLTVLRKEYSASCIKPVEGSVRALLRGKIQFDNLDFVYSLGLFDYLEDPAAKQLLRVIFDMLKPGGQMLVANFAPNLYNIGYMEAFMDWFLIYRDEFDMDSLTEEIESSLVEERRIYRDSYKNIVFLELRKCG